MRNLRWLENGLMSNRCGISVEQTSDGNAWKRESRQNSGPESKLMGAMNNERQFSFCVCVCLFFAYKWIWKQAKGRQVDEKQTTLREVSGRKRFCMNVSELRYWTPRGVQAVCANEADYSQNLPLSSQTNFSSHTERKQSAFNVSQSKHFLLLGRFYLVLHSYKSPGF